MNKVILALVSFVICLSILGCDGTPITVVFQQKGDYTGTLGKKCKVTDGPNKGKTGTYDEDGDCCDQGPGGWGCTGCKKSDGSSNGKCEDAAKVVVSDYFAGADRAIVVDGYYELPDGLVHCVTSVPLVSGAAAKAICFPLSVDKLSDLQNSQDEVDKRIVDAIESSIRELTLETR